MSNQKHKYPAYYELDSQLTIQLPPLSDDQPHTAVSFTVLKALTPFTTSEVLLVKLVNESSRLQLRAGSVVILKVYDPRFSRHRFEMGTKTPWSYALELRASESNPRPFHRFPTDQSSWNFYENPAGDDPVWWEDWHYKYTEHTYQGEARVYDTLTSLQGTSIPRLYSSGTLQVEEPRAVSINVLLLEYIDDAKNLAEIENAGAPSTHSLIPPALAKSALEIIASFGRLGVVHCDLNGTNVLVQRGRIVVIDFGQAHVREGEGKKRWGKIVIFNGDRPAMGRVLAGALGLPSIKVVDEYAGYRG